MKYSTKMAIGISLGMFAIAPTVRAMPSYISTTSTWTQNGPPLSLGDATGHFCYLTRVSGHFVGGAEWVRVWSGDPTQGNATGGSAIPGTTWWVGGNSLQAGVTASANCLPYSTFKAEPGTGSVNNWTAWLSQNTGPTFQTGQGCTTLLFFSLGCYASGPTLQENAWQGDATAMISGMTGQFVGGGESISIAQAASPWLFNTFTVGAESYNGVGGWIQGLFVGIPESGFNPSFFGPNAAGPTNATAAGVFSATASSANFSGSVTTLMAPTSKAICYLTGITGAFYGGGESVAIGTTETEAGEVWSLTVTSQQQNGTGAQARCYALDQSVSR